MEPRSRDREDAKSSTGGYIVLVGPGAWFPITWVFVKQGHTARSTTEAETSALAHCLIQERYPIWDLLEAILGRKVVLRVQEDNQEIIKVVESGYSPNLRQCNDLARATSDRSMRASVSTTP